MNSRLISLVLTICVFVLDRISKIWVMQHVSPQEDWTVIPGLLNIIHSQNRAMAFSLLNDAPDGMRSVFLIGASGLAVCAVAILLWRAQDLSRQLALSLILGGALGNLYERLFRGSVTDFLDLHLGQYHWFTFNVADSAISVGALLIAVELLMNRKSVATNSF